MPVSVSPNNHPHPQGFCASGLPPPSPDQEHEGTTRLNQEGDPAFLLWLPTHTRVAQDPCLLGIRSWSQHVSSLQALSLPPSACLLGCLGHQPCTHLTFMICPRPGWSSGSGCSSPARIPVQFMTISTPWANT